jgi:hypothetical protein
MFYVSDWIIDTKLEFTVAGRYGGSRSDDGNNLYSSPSQGGWDGRHLQNAWEQKEIGRQHWSENLKGRFRYRWEDNIKVNHKEMLCEGVDWIHMAQYRNQ